MAKAICKNTFITFVAEDVEDSTRQMLPHRSRSAEPALRRPEAETQELQEMIQQSLQNLNAVLCTADRKQLGQTPCPKQKLWGEQHHHPSGSSLSTMVLDDGSDGGSSRSATPGLLRLTSSDSVSTVVSERTLGEEDKVEIELNIKAGPAMSQRKEAVVPKAATPEMSHGQVPKNHNMLEKYDSARDGAPTTMMIRNIPGRYSQQDLMSDLQDLGLHGTYDFLYIPIDKSTAANVGYAFVNFTDATWAEKCKNAFENYHFWRRGQKRSSNKVAIVSVAHLQGLEKNLQHYENAAVNMSRDKRRKPVVLFNIAKILA